MTPHLAAAPLSSVSPLSTRIFGPSAAAAGRTVAVYVVVATLWIFLTDGALQVLGLDARQIAELSVAKGGLFVLVTGGVLFWRLRHEMEQRRKHEEPLKIFVEHAPVAIAMLDRDLRYVTASRRWLVERNLGEQDLRGHRHYDLYDDVPASWRDAHRRALQGESVHMEADRVVEPDGRVTWIRWEVRPWIENSGAIGGIVIFSEDITERMQVEAALAESRARLRLALECGRVGIWSWEVGPGLLTCDEALASLVGRTKEEITAGGQQQFYASLHPADLESVRSAATAALRDGTDFLAEYRLIRPDGTVVWFANRASVERDSAGHPLRMTGASVDITAIKRIEGRLHDSESRFREVVETIHEVFWIMDVAQQRVIYVSPGYETVWGRSCQSLYEHPNEWSESLHPDDRERVQSAATHNQTGGSYDETYRIIRPDDTIRWVRDQAFPVRDEQGRVVRIVGTVEDITERKKLEEQFLHAQRLEAIGTLASGVAHDLNNILAPLFMVGPLLRAKLTDPHDAEMLTIIENSAQRGSNVIRQLLTFSRGIAGERGLLQARHLAKEMVAIMNETFPRQIGITQEIYSDLWPIVGDATQLHQVLMNLCVNARDAMPDGGRITIKGQNVELTEHDLRLHPALKPGRYVLLSVIDSGPGIPPEIRPRIFDPFFTTKAIGKGTGLGLSTVLGIVKSHGGFITLDTEIGRGCAFHIHLPSAELTELVPTTPVAPALPGGRGELVLVVDDEPAVRLTTQQVLERNGYRVLTASDGREGLGIFLIHREHVRAVVTDLMMPEMSGVALVRSLRDLSQGLAILAATGLQEAEDLAALSALGVNEVLPKPYAPFELLDALERELSRTRPSATLSAAL